MLPFLRPRKIGTHIPKEKNTEDDETVTMPVPSKIILPMSQHIGNPAKPVVKEGDFVRVGTLIGEGQGRLSSHIHSGVSGHVESISQIRLPRGVFDAVTILSNGKQTNDFNIEVPEVYDYPSFITALSKSGIVGHGGAGYPTHAKLSNKHPKTLHTLCVNCAECEPFITVDNRTLVEDTSDITKGILAIMEYLDLENCYIAIESRNYDTIEIMEDEIEELEDNDEDFPYAMQVVKLPNHYPHGADRIIVRQCTGITMASHTAPSDYGIIVQNVSTVAEIARYLETGMPMVKRRVTVDGDVVSESNNVMTIVGTPLEELFEFCGGFLEEPEKVLYNGPMMGVAVADLNLPTLKNINAALAFSEDYAEMPKMSHCIHCGCCTRVCPMGLSPKELAQASHNRDSKTLIALSAPICFSCGTCSFVCPAKRPISQEIAVGKRFLRGIINE